MSVSTRGRCLEALDIFILAGGLGTRIRPVLGDLPKILAPILGRPYLAYLLDWLERFGARRVVLGLGHRAQAVIEYLEKAPPAGQLEVATVVEPSPLGTAGAIRFARGALRSDPVLIMNGDSFTDADLCAFVDHHSAANARGSVLCAEVDDAGRYGRVEIDQGGYIHGFVEKDAAFHGRALINAGVYLLSGGLLDISLQAKRLRSNAMSSSVCHPGRLPPLPDVFALSTSARPKSLAQAAGVFGAEPRG